MFRVQRLYVRGLPACSAALGLAVVMSVGGCAAGEPGTEAAGPASDGSGSGSTTSATPSGAPEPAPVITSAALPYKPATAEGPAENVPLPVMPALAKEESREGLVAFAEYYFQLANYGYESGDADPIRALSGESCFSCGSYLRVINSGYIGDDWMTGAMITTHDISSNYVKTDEGYYQVLIPMVQEPVQFYGEEGLLGGETESTGGTQLMEATYMPNGWYVIHMETLQLLE